MNEYESKTNLLLELISRHVQDWQVIMMYDMYMIQHLGQPHNNPHSETIEVH
jgi:hypothetical protein